MKKIGIGVIVIAVICGFFFVKDIYEDRQNSVIISSETPMYSDPYGYVNEKNPLKIQIGESLKVLRITHTKDFRVIHIERADKSEGWIIDGDGVALSSKDNKK